MKFYAMFFFFVCLMFVETKAQTDLPELNKLISLIDDQNIRKKTANIHEVMDYDALIDRIIIDTPENQEFNEYIKKESKPNLKQGFEHFFQSIYQKNLAHHSFYRHKKIDDETFELLFRIFIPSNAINYVTYKVILQKSAYKIVDFYSIKTGEYYSETIRRDVYLPMLLSYHENNNLSEELTESLNLIESINILDSLKIAGQIQTAYEFCKNLPLNIQNNKLIKIYEFEIYRSEDSIGYLAKIEEYEKLYPNDPSLYLKLLDKYLLTKNYKRALKYLEKISEVVNHDPFLDLIRARIFWYLGNFSKSKQYCFSFLEKFSDNREVYFYLAYNFIFEKKYAQAILHIDEVVEKFNEQKKRLVIFFETNPNFQSFVYSKEFIDWKSK